ncbi:hypothetical protein I7X12_04020 [Halosimplex litoreum]|uniref:Uncharacterized protein n=1 Tax=Halosimplex litoreum TaxID=1198301 RepID=A0A7T3FZX1_9EURY|nr:hypothetical protein [Halosimplex litoreum]QPV63805.1 hypothetical protein I7X12_04020 [Halosimplex litoreum]
MGDRVRADGPTPSSGLATDARGVTPAVGKTLEIGIVVLFVGLVTTALLGGVVPDYRTAAGAEVGDRVLATVAQEVERAVPPSARDVSARRTVELPSTIAGSGYAIRVDGRSLVLDHPDPAIGGRIDLAVPPRVDRVSGRTDGGAETVVAVRDGPDGLVVELRDGGGP